MEPTLAHIYRMARISACVALRKETQLEQELHLAVEGGISVTIVREVLLQTYLFAGYAATINAFIVLNRIVPENSEYLQEENGSLEIWRKRGEELCKLIYGDHYSKLMKNMRQLHPDLADWIIVEGYGKVLSRPFLAPRIRELLIVAMTAVLQVERQFQSHVRGSIHAGATPDELRSVLGQLRDFIEPGQWQNFFALLEACLS